MTIDEALWQLIMTILNSIIREKPPKTDSSQELQHWMCEVHNIVNDSLDKPQFNCKYVGSRWKSCDESLEGACAIQPHSRRGNED